MKNQKGFTLIVAMVLLTSMSLISTTLYNMSSTDVQIQYNIKSKESLRSAISMGIEQTLDTVDIFANPVEQSLTINGYTVEIDKPVCTGYRLSGGSSARNSLAKQETFWTIKARAIDTVSGAFEETTQGIRITMLAGSCV